MLDLIAREMLENPEHVAGPAWLLEETLGSRGSDSSSDVEIASGDRTRHRRELIHPRIGGVARFLNGIAGRAAKLSRGSNKFPTVCTFPVRHSISRDGHPVFRPRRQDIRQGLPPGADNVSREQFDISSAGRSGIGSRSPVSRKIGNNATFRSVTRGNHFYSGTARRYVRDALCIDSRG